MGDWYRPKKFRNRRVWGQPCPSRGELKRTAGNRARASVRLSHFGLTYTAAGRIIVGRFERQECPFQFSTRS